MARDSFSRGHSTPLGGHFRSGTSWQMTAPMQVEAILTHEETGLRLIICGDSKIGDHHVCGG